MLVEARARIFEREDAAPQTPTSPFALGVASSFRGRAWRMRGYDAQLAGELELTGISGGLAQTLTESALRNGVGARLSLAGDPFTALFSESTARVVVTTSDPQAVKTTAQWAGVRVTDEQPVLFSDRGRPDGVFDQVVVDPREGVLLVRDQHIPVVEQVGACLSQLRLWQYLLQ